MTSSTAGSASALPASLWRSLLHRCGEDVAAIVAALERRAYDVEHPRDPSYAPERYSERGSVELAALVAIFAPFIALAIVVVLLVGVAR